MTIDLQDRCELGQQQLMRQEYLAAERTLSDAEAAAWQLRDFDTLARLYMPLQEARRQRRQRCGEGVVCLDLLAESESDEMSARHVLENYPCGQLLVAGWGSIEPALDVRRVAWELGLYVETFLAAVYPIAQGRMVVIVPTDDVPLPPAARIGSAGEYTGARRFDVGQECPTYGRNVCATGDVGVRRSEGVVGEYARPAKAGGERNVGATVEQLLAKVPAGCIVLRDTELPAGPRKGSPQTYSQVMNWWERLHRPVLEAARAESDPLRRIAGYRQAIEVDYACELAHQNLSDLAHELARCG